MTIAGWPVIWAFPWSPPSRVVVKGHTDSQGSSSLNKDLSERRAASVLRYLTDKGVIADRLISSGQGEEKPIASNATSQGRATNRRVEFIIVQDDEGGAPEPPASGSPSRGWGHGP